MGCQGPDEPLCPAGMSLPGRMIQTDSFACLGEAGHVAGDVWICRVLGVCFQHPSAIRRCSGLAEVPGSPRHPQAVPRHWDRDTQSTRVAPAQPCQGGASTLVPTCPAGAGTWHGEGSCHPSPLPVCLMVPDI